MAEEIQEAVQIIRVAYDGIEIAMKVGSGGIAAMQKAIDFLKGMLDYEKSLGRPTQMPFVPRIPYICGWEATSRNTQYVLWLFLM